MNRDICVNLINQFNIGIEKELDAIKNANFDGVFFTWQRNLDVDYYVNEIRKRNLKIEFFHAPFGKIFELWNENSEVADDVLLEQKECILAAKKYNVDKVIVHPFIGFKAHNPTLIGLKRFEELVKFATINHVKIAFENLEGECYLALIAKELFPKYENACFCFDSGHEMCYNDSMDLLKLYGDKCIALHINDNLGIRHQMITFHDDLHYLPGDGILDINYLINRLKKINYQGAITLELKLGRGKIYNSYRKIGAFAYYKKAYTIAKNIKDRLDD